MTTKIFGANKKVLAELSSVQIAGTVGRMGTDFVASGGPELMSLTSQRSGMQMVHQGNVYNCMVQTSNMVSNASGSGFAIRGKIWPC